MLIRLQQFMRLPVEERHRQIREQAEKALDYYENDPTWREIQEGDLLDY